MATLFGYQSQGGTTSQTLEATIVGTAFTTPAAPTAPTGGSVSGYIIDSITVYNTPSATQFTTKCAIYLASDHSLVSDSATDVFTGVATGGWHECTYSGTKPVLAWNTSYILVAWSNSRSGTNLISHDANGAANVGHVLAASYGTFPSSISSATTNANQYSIYASGHYGVTLAAPATTTQPLVLSRMTPTLKLALAVAAATLTLAAAPDQPTLTGGSPPAGGDGTIADCGSITNPSSIPQQRKLLYDGTNWWAFYFKSGTADTLFYAYSTDLYSWTESSTALASTTVLDGGALSVTYRQSVQTALIQYQTTTNNSRYIRAVITPGGPSIAFGATTTTFDGGSVLSAVTPYSKGFVGGLLHDGSPMMGRFHDAVADIEVGDVYPTLLTSTFADTGATWTLSSAYTPNTSTTGKIVPYTYTGYGERMKIFFNDSSVGLMNINVGSGPDMEAVSATTNDPGIKWDAVDTATQIFLLRDNGAGAFEFMVWTGETQSWATVTAPAYQASGTNCGLSLCTDGTDLWAFTIDSSYNVKYIKRTGSTWAGSWTTLVAGGSAPRTYIQASFNCSSNGPAALYTEYNNSTYELHAVGFEPAPPAGGDKDLYPAAADPALSLSPLTPTLTHVIAPAAGTLTLTPMTPGGNLFLTPGAATLTLAPETPGKTITEPDVPTMVQHVSSSYTGAKSAMTDPGKNDEGCTSFRLPLNHPTQAGNCLVVAVMCDTTATITVSDDQTNTYDLGISYDNDDAYPTIRYALNVAAGTKVITVDFSVASGWVQVLATEFANVASASALDGTSGNTGTSNSITAGSISPTTSGDLIYQYAMMWGDNRPTPVSAGSQSNITWKLLSVDNSNLLIDNGTAWSMAQWGVYNSTSAINPTMTQSTGGAGSFITAAICLKAGASGSVPTGMRIKSAQHINLPAGGYWTNGFAYPFPSSGNLLVIEMLGMTDYITSITDSNANAWNVSSHVENGTLVQFAWAADATTSSDLTITVNWSPGTAHDNTMLLFDVDGAATNPYDSVAGVQFTTGNQNNPGTITGAAITPTTSDGLIFTTLGVDFNTISGLTNANAVLLTQRYTGQRISGPSPIDENNGWGYYPNSSTSQFTPTWTGLNEVIAVGDYAGGSIHFAASDITDTYLSPAPASLTLTPGTPTKTPEPTIIAPAAAALTISLPSAILLEDFASNREGPLGGQMWDWCAPGEDPGQVWTVSGGLGKCVGASGGGIYFDFLPQGHGDGRYPWPQGFQQGAIKSGTFTPTINRLRFRFRVGSAVSKTGGDVASYGNLQIGTYIKPHDYPDTNEQGAHYYHHLDPNCYPGHWIYVELNSHPQSQVATSDRPVNDPEWNNPGWGAPVHYYDGMTRWYVDTQIQAAWGSPNYIEIDDLYYAYESGCPDTEVSSLTGTYNGTRYEVVWSCPAYTEITYDVRYSTSSMKESGFLSGTDGGQVVRGSDGAPCLVSPWLSPVMSEVANFYVAIRPVGYTDFTEFKIPNVPMASGGGFAPTLTIGTVIAPAAASLTLAPETPTRGGAIYLAPAAGTLTFAPITPTLTLKTKAPTAASLTCTGSPGKLTLTPHPAAATLAFTGITPSLTLKTKPPTTATLTLTGGFPTLPGGLVPTTASLTLVGSTPNLSLTIAAPAAASLTLSPATSARIDGTHVAPAAGSLTLAASTSAHSLTIAAPSAASLTATGATSSLTLTLAPAAGSLTLTEGAPGLNGSVTLIPQTAALTFAAGTPSLTVSLGPAAGSLTLSGQTSPFSLAIAAPAAASLTLTAATPSLGGAVNVMPAAASLSFAPVTPKWTLRIAAPAAAALTVAAETPTRILGTRLSPAAATLTLAGATSPLSLRIGPAAASLTLTGSNPSLGNEKRIAPAAASLTLAVGTPPPLSLRIGAPEAAALTLSPETPYRRVGRYLAPATGSALTLTGASSTLDLKFAPAAAALTLGPETPTLTIHAPDETAITPFPTTLSLTESTPTLLEISRPAAGSLAFARVTPRLTLTVAAPAAASLTLSAQSPGRMVDVRVSPAAASLTLAGGSAALGITLPAPLPATLSLSLEAPYKRIGRYLAPAAGSLTLAPVTPTSSLRLAPTPGSLTLTPETPGRTATDNANLAPAPASLTLTGSPAWLGKMLAPAAGSLTLAPATPALRSGLVPPAASLTATPEAAITLAIVLHPASASLTLTPGYPGLNGEVYYRPGVGALSLAPATPTLSLTVAPAAASLTLAPETPGATNGIVLSPASATLTLAGTAPSATLVIGVPPATLTVTEQAVWLSLAIPPGGAALTLACESPTLRNGPILEPAPAELLFTTVVPALLVNAPPAAAALTLTGGSPTVGIKPGPAMFSLKAELSYYVITLKGET